MKRCVLAGCVALLLCVAGAALADSEKGYAYTVEDGGATITGYAGMEMELVIPDTLGGFPVRGIGKRAFSRNATITSAILPEGIETMEKAAFAECPALKRVSLPNTLEVIPDEAFAECPVLEEVNIAEETRRIRPRAFYGCTALASIDLPPGCRMVGDWAFADCTSLMAVGLPDVNSGCTYGRQAFENTPWLHSRGSDFVTVTTSFGQQLLIRYLGHDQSVSIPNGVYAIEGAFDGNQDVLRVTLPMSCTRVNAYGFVDCENLVEIVATSRFYKTGQYAFQNCRSLQRFPYYNEKTEYILRGTFDGCESLADINLPDSILRIEEAAFRGCASLTEIRLPNRLQTLEESVLEGCGALTSIVLPMTLESIGPRALAQCTALESLTLPEYMTSIGPEAFAGCTSLASLRVPRRVTEISSDAFVGCEKLVLSVVHESYAEAFAIEHEIPYEYYDEFARSYVYRMADNGAVIEVYAGSEENLSLPRRISGAPVVAIDAAAFQDNQSLQSVAIPEGVTEIGDWAFSYCESLRDVSLPSGMRTIGADAFSGCVCLQSVNIPASVTSIGARAFQDCADLVLTVAAGGVGEAYAREEGIAYVVGE